MKTHYCLLVEEKVPERFICRYRHFAKVDLNGIDIIQNGLQTMLPQSSYASNMTLKDHGIFLFTKQERAREIYDEELKIIHSGAGKLAWLGTGYSPLAAFQASLALQGGKKNPETIHIVLVTWEVSYEIRDDVLTCIRYSILDLGTIDITLFTDAAFRNMAKKTSQIGLVLFLSDKQSKFNIIHRNSSRAPRRPHSTEESKFMALDVGTKSLRNI